MHKTSRFDEKRIIPLLLAKYSLIDGHHGNRERSILELLVLKDSLYNNYTQKVVGFGED